MENFVNINRISTNQINDLLELARYYRSGNTSKLLRPTYATNLFFENSTRTHSSFQMAEKKLGIKLIGVNPSTSSITKGETLRDTVKVLQVLGNDLVVIRHPETRYYQRLVDDNSLKISIVNAGDGEGQHPSQTLLDLLTIQDEFSHFKNLNVGIIGDLTHSRVAKSDAEILHRLGANVYFSGPKKWYSNDLKTFGTFTDLDKLLPKLDVVMPLRVQLERFDEKSVDSFTRKIYYQKFGITKDRAELMQKHAILMHPAPVNRDIEVASSLVEAPQSRIFKQMYNGVYARMAILATLLHDKGLMKLDPRNNDMEDNYENLDS